MKKLIFCIVLLGSAIAFSSPAFSQSQSGQGNGGQGREPDYVKFKTDLSLTDAQVTSWQNLDEKYKPQMQALRSNTSLSEEDKKAQMTQIRASKDTDLKAILSADQYTKLQTLRTQQRGERGNGGGGNHNH